MNYFVRIKKRKYSDHKLDENWKKKINYYCGLFYRNLIILVGKMEVHELICNY